MSVDDRLLHERSRFAEDLLSYMTLEEKLGQLDLFHSSSDPALEERIGAGLVGGVAGANLPVRLQALAMDRSRLGIPLLLVNEGVRLAISPWALAASWDEKLLSAVGSSTAREAANDGFNCVLAPQVGDDAQNPLRRLHISTSEPHLSARLAAAFALGTSEASHDPRSAVMAIAAWQGAPSASGVAWFHGIAHSGASNAIECASLDRAAAQCTGFSGILVAECRRITSIVARHFHNSSVRSAIESAERALSEGLVSELEIDAAVRGVIWGKHSLSLFRDAQRIIAPSSASQSYARDDQRVRGTFVLLRNEAGLLPLSPVSDRVLVVGMADGVGGACADALGRAGIANSLAPGLAQRLDGDSWATPVAGDQFALSLTCDAARRSDFVLVALEDRHFELHETGWRRPTPAILAMLRGLSQGSVRLLAVIATSDPVDLADADQHFAGVLQCWDPTAGFEEALSDVLSGRFSPQGRMPTSAGRYVTGHGLGYSECVVSGYCLTAGQEEVVASVNVRNSGNFASRETVQVYARTAERNLRLVAFDHIDLAPGEEAKVAFALGLEALGVPGVSNRLELTPGHHEILVGKSANRLLAATIEIPASLARAIVARESGFLRLAVG